MLVEQSNALIATGCTLCPFSFHSYCTESGGQNILWPPLTRRRTTRHTMSLPTPRLDCARLALLRPGDPLEQLQAALGASWGPPRAKDDGWWRPVRHLDGFRARIGADSRLVSVWFYGNFSRRCAVEDLRIHMPLASALARQPSLRKLDSISGPRRDVRHVRCHQGYHLFVHFYQARLWRLCLEAPDALHHS